MGAATGGAVAAGSEAAVRAGLRALEAGGNAVDAAVAANFAAFVAEPLLTGVAGAGIAAVRAGERVEIWDLFADAPARPRPGARMEAVEVDFGPTTQVFHVGAAAVAPACLPAGLQALHDAHGRLPWSSLVRPAAELARSGVPVTPGFARVVELLWPILERREEAARRFSRGGRPLRAGDRFTWPELAGTLDRIAAEGAEALQSGSLGRAVAAWIDGRGHLDLDDLRRWRPLRRAPLSASWRGARIHVPGPPSLAGLLVLQALRVLDDGGPVPPPGGAEEVRRVARAVARTVDTRDTVAGGLFEPAFVAGFRAALAWDRPRLPGHTTHVSAVDAEGGAVGITTSLGESCGEIVPGTGILLNNFLGEEDVNPPGSEPAPGRRLVTMCCPTVIERPAGEGSAAPGEVLVLGSGGSSRIRTALLHGVLHLVGHGAEPAEAVAAARCHVEGGRLHVETEGRPPETLDAIGDLLAAEGWELRRFEQPSMFFGGLHVAGVRLAGGAARFVGAGDPRRSGRFGATGPG